MSRLVEGKGAERFEKAADKLCALFPEFTILWHKVREVRAREDIPTCAIDINWKVYVNDAFYLGLPEEEALFVAAHEVFHPVLGHFERAQALGIVDEKGRALNPQNAQTWNRATDACINHALTCLGLRLPHYAVTVPQNYKGPLDAESIYTFLKKDNPPDDGASGAQEKPSPGEGCGMLPVEEVEVSLEEYAQVQGQLAEAARIVGKGNLYFALTAGRKTEFPNWERLLRAAFTGLNAKHGYNTSSYARPRRIGDGLLPRYLDTMPVLGVVVDTSGSLSREQVKAIIEKTLALVRTYPSVKVALVTHTDEVNHAGFIDANTTASKLARACGYTGGTAVAPAYVALKKLAGTCDWVVHFTDCYIENEWPKVPGKRLLVGDFGGGRGTRPPAGAKVMQC
jgi:predicted metal-dependent peptidase